VAGGERQAPDARNSALEPLRHLGTALPRLLVSFGIAVGLTAAVIAVGGVLLAGGRAFTELFKTSGSAWPAIVAIPVVPLS
jgi:hypothetical protein